MADYKHPKKRKSASLKISTDSIPSQLPVYSSPPLSDAGWNRFDPFVDNPPDYPDSSEEADADESDQEVTVHNRRRLASPQVYVSPFQSSPRKARRHPHQFHSPTPSLPSHRTRSHARTPGLRHAASNSDSYLDSLLARSVHALEISNTLLESSIATKSSMSSALSTDSPTEESLEESATGLSKRIMKSKDLQKNWIDDLEEIGKRVDSLFGGPQDETEGGSGSGNGQSSQIPIQTPTRDATSPISQSLPISSGLPQTLAERRRGQDSPSLAIVTQTPEGRLGFSAHNRSHFVAPPPRALTVYIGSDDTDPDAIKLPPTLGVRSPPQPAHPHLFSATSSVMSSPVLSKRTSFSDMQSVETNTSEVPAATPLRAYDILSSFVTPRRGSNKVIRSQSFGSNTTPTRPVNIRRGQASPTRSEVPDMSASPISRGRSLTPLRTIQLDPQSHSPLFSSKPLTPPIEELPSANSSSESDSQTNLAVTSLRKIFMDDQALAVERERLLSASRSLSNSTAGARMRPPPRLLAPPALPEASTSHATASVSRLLTKNKHSSSARPPSPPRQSSLRSPSVRSRPLSPAPSPSPSLLHIPSIFASGSGGSNNGSGRSTPNRVSFAALPESYGDSKPGGPDERFSREGRRKRKRPGNRSPLNASSGGQGFDDDSDDGKGWGWWADWLLADNVGTTTLRLDQEAMIEQRAARWGLRPSPV